MTISRRAFLITTTAFTTINLYFPAVSAEINPETLSRTHWYAVYFQPMDKSAVKIGDFIGLERYSLPDNTFLTFSDHDRWKLRHARPGGRPADQTVHFFKEIDEYIPPENIGLKEMLEALKAHNPDLNQQIQDAFTESDGSLTVFEHYAKHVSDAYGISNEGSLGKEFWGELEQAIRGE